MGEYATRGDEREDAPSFPRPPRTATDREGRCVSFETVGEGAFEQVVELYDGLDPADRSQGVPPPSRTAIESWIADLLPDGIHVVAGHDGSVVGHACLLPTGDGRHELLIFVASDYQEAGIGTALLRSLLGRGSALGVERVWLTVRRENVVARRLYESAGFERAGDGIESMSSDVEMERWL